VSTSTTHDDSWTSDETLIIETPERVGLEFALASLGNRFLACAFDHFLQLTVIFIASAAVYFAGDFEILGARFAEAPKWVQAGFVIFAFVMWNGYFALFETFWAGQTPGKRLLKLRVLREDGRPVTFWEAMVRNLLRIFDIQPFVFYSIGLVSIFITPRDQRIGDLFAGTVVVRERAAEAPRFDEVFGRAITDTALRRSYKPVLFTGDVRRITAAEIDVVERLLRRRWDLPDKVREWMAWRIATPILFKLQPEFDRTTFTYEGFLEELLHRYRAARRYED
jgi:uncharacterized RDD family membrane protein YckC